MNLEVAKTSGIDQIFANFRKGDAQLIRILAIPYNQMCYLYFKIQVLKNKSFILKMTLD